jgi:hypothetical protein
MTVQPMTDINSRSGRVSKLKERIRAIKDVLPANYKNMVLEILPQYKTVYGIGLITNVVNLRSTDEDITTALESIVNNLKKQA